MGILTNDSWLMYSSSFLCKQVTYVADDSTIFWATGVDSTVIAKRAEMCGKEIEMTVPFEGENAGEV